MNKYIDGLYMDSLQHDYYLHYSSPDSPDETEHNLCWKKITIQGHNKIMTTPDWKTFGELELDARLLPFHYICPTTPAQLKTEYNPERRLALITSINEIRKLKKSTEQGD